MNFVVDASVALAWCFEDEGGAYVVDILEVLRSSEAVVPALWPLEVSNGLLTAERRGRLEPADAVRFARLLLALPLVVEPAARSRAFHATRSLASRHRLTAYDAAYLELATRLGIPLASIDDALRAAAVDEGVGMFEV